MLKFNTFRSQRYLRSRFIEGTFLLASEATDMELELIDFTRALIRNQVGNTAIADAWKIERIDQLNFRVKPGEAWFDGLPYFLRSSGDQLVSGNNLSLGIVPVGTSIADDTNGTGKIVTMDGSTANNTFRIVIQAKEEVITDLSDEFIKNANLTESTAQKMRLNYTINIVPEGDQNDSPVPYTGDNSTDKNLANEITINVGSAASPGSLVSINQVTGSENIDGRDIEVVITNQTGNNPLPKSIANQSSFSGGKLIDSLGNEYHIVSIFNNPSDAANQDVIRIDKEVDQSDPVISLNSSYRMIKRDVFTTDDVNGSPLGKRYYSVASMKWKQTTGMVHDTVLTDLRTSIEKVEENQFTNHTKFDLRLAEGGNISWEVTDNDILTWVGTFSLINPHGPEQTMPANSVALKDGGAIVYFMDLVSGGVIAKGNLAITVSSGDTTLNLSGAPDLSNISIGNTIVVGGELRHIIDINNVSKQITLDTARSSALATTGTIYLDSYAPATAPLDKNLFVLAVRKNDRVNFGQLELESNETNTLGESLPQAILTFTGSTGDADSDPNYTSTNIVTQGVSLTTSISELDVAVQAILTAIAVPVYDERILYPAGLTALTSVTIPLNSRNGNIQETYTPGSGDIEIFVNTRYTYEDEIWESTGVQTIRFLVDLPADTEVHFRRDTLGAGGGGGGGGSGNFWSDPVNSNIVPDNNNMYDLGSSGNKFKDGYFAGKLTVDGVIDPTGLELVPQGSNPLDPGQLGIYVNTSEELILQKSASFDNISEKLVALESGSGVTVMTRDMTNNTGAAIPINSVVYSPVAGEIALADGTDDVKARAIGITTEEIADSAMGKVAYTGMASGVVNATGGGGASGTILNNDETDTPLFGIDVDQPGNVTQFYANKFTAGVSSDINSIDLYLELATGAFDTGVFIVEIREDLLGSPGPLVQTSDSVNSPSIPASQGFSTFTFSTPATIVDTQDYWVVLKSTTTLSFGVLKWFHQSTAGSVGDTKRTNDAGGTWPSSFNHSLIWKADYGSATSIVLGEDTDTPVVDFIALSTNIDRTSASYFVSGSDGDLSNVKFYLSKGVGATGFCRAKLYTGTSSSPTTVLATSDAVDISTLPDYNSPTYIDFNFSTPYAITSGSEYWIALSSDGISDFVYTYQANTIYGSTVTRTANTPGVWSVSPSTKLMVVELELAGAGAGSTPFTHGSYLYLDQTVGVLTETRPSLPAYPAGFQVMLIGVIEEENLHLQITPIGTL